jgi:hypothetical protein
MRRSPDRVRSGHSLFCVMRPTDPTSVVIESIQIRRGEELGAPVKPNPTPDEMLLLLEQLQYESLLKAPYLLMPRAEREAYDRRRVHIEELRELLRKDAA